METQLIRRPSSLHGSVSYHSILIGSLSFVAGGATILLFMNTFDAGQVTFSVTGIISFVFGIALSAASIVLAVAAITLGRASERATTERSDESIRLQNEVFAKTTEALSRIESSTGVTEKRIEDIIAGRAGAIAERLVEHRQIGSRSREEIEREIRESVRSELPASLRMQIEPKSKELEAKIKEAHELYEKFKNKVLFHISDQQSTKTRKIGDGKYRGSGDDLADGVFETASGRVAVCTFSINPILAQQFLAGGDFITYIDSILGEIASNTFHKVFFVYDGKLDADNAFAKQIESRRLVAKEELCSRLIVVAGELPEVLERLSKEFAAR